MDEAAHLLHFLFFDELEGIEVADLAGNLAGKGGGVELGYAVNTALAREQGLPHRVSGIAHCADQADAGNDDPSFQITRQITCLPSRVCRCTPSPPKRCESFPPPRRGFQYRRPLRRPSRARRYRAN